MEAGYSARYSSETHISGDGGFTQSEQYSSSPYAYSSPPSVKPKANIRDSGPFPESVNDANLPRRLSILTNALNQGKPISVDDLMSLRIDNEVSYYSITFTFIYMHFTITGSIKAQSLLIITV